MKTAEEFIKEIEVSDALKDELKAVKDGSALAEFLKKHGCDADVKEFMAFVRSQSEGEIGDDEAKAAAGGWRYSPDEKSLRPRTIKPHLR